MKRSQPFVLPARNASTASLLNGDRGLVPRWLLALLVALFLTVIGAEESLAQGQAPAAKSDLEQQYDQAFQAMFEDPANLDKAFAYARLAIQMLDFEGAISTLERMLIINADLPRVRMELGVLYYRLRS
jgi:tetratricopeptide (TPR) repeat protein